jgi:hypothetical protein
VNKRLALERDLNDGNVINAFPETKSTQN